MKHLVNTNMIRDKILTHKICVVEIIMFDDETKTFELIKSQNFGMEDKL